LHRIRGVVLGPDGEPLEGITVDAVLTTPFGLTTPSETGPDGRFEVDVRDGSYLFSLRADVCRFGWYGADGTAGDGGAPPETMARAVVDGSDVTGLVFKLPISPSAMCGQIRGIVLGPRDEPLQGIHVMGRPRVLDGGWTAVTDSQGRFSRTVRHTAFELSLSADGCHLGWYVESDGLTTDPDNAMTVSASPDGEPATVIRLPAAPSNLCSRVAGTVTGSNGRPLGKHALSATAHGYDVTGPAHHTTTAADGTFAIMVRDGRYRLGLHARGNCTVNGREHVGARGAATVVVEGEDVSEVHVVVTERAQDTERWTVCSASPELVTTELQPGFNLVGWLGSETSAASLFDAIPELLVVYAWDTDAEAFRWAARANSEIAGNLGTLPPGSGLWLGIGGHVPVTWTHAASGRGHLGRDAGIAGLFALSEGWNLVAWAGRDGIAPGKALASLGASVASVSTWESEGRRWLQYDPRSPASSNLDSLKRGAGLWLRMLDERTWLQPGAVTPALEFHRKASPERKALLAETVDGVVTYFAERYGVVAPGVTFVLEGGGGCEGFQQTEVISLRECRGFEDNQFTHLVAHEYSHALQHHMGAHITSWWLSEGGAEFWATQYVTRNGPSYDTLRDALLPHLWLNPIPLRDATNYSTAHLGVDFLVQTVGETAFLALHEAKSSHERWEDAFEAALGMSVDDFYEAFEAYRAEVAPPRQHVRGTVLGPDGEPLTGWQFSVEAFPSGAGRQGLIGVGGPSGDGTFTLRLVPGTYDLSIQAHCQPVFPNLGWHGGESGFTTDYGEVTPVTVSGDVEGIAIRLPAWPSSLSAACDFGPRRVLSGVTTDSDGNPLPGFTVTAQEVSEPSKRDTTVVGADGTFTLNIPDGTYRLDIHEACGIRLGFYDAENDSFAEPPIPDFRAATQLHVEVRGEGATGIRIAVPSGPLWALSGRTLSEWLARTAASGC
jgi:hypothetical protein